MHDVNRFLLWKLFHCQALTFVRCDLTGALVIGIASFLRKRVANPPTTQPNKVGPHNTFHFHPQWHQALQKRTYSIKDLNFPHIHTAPLPILVTRAWVARQIVLWPRKYLVRLLAHIPTGPRRPRPLRRPKMRPTSRPTRAASRPSPSCRPSANTSPRSPTSSQPSAASRR
jgi:hypothetical protein